jgi:nucleotide-binding universal stress UspA family protein
MATSSGIRRIVVGVDGSEHSDAAVAWTARMAKGMGSEVVAVFAIAPPVYFDSAFAPPVQMPQYDPEWRAEMKKEFEQSWSKALKTSGVKYRTVMDDGRPASVISQVADDVDADVIVVGRRGRGGVAELVLGSVSHELVLHSKRPVLVISGLPQRGRARSRTASRPARSTGAAQATKGSRTRSR